MDLISRNRLYERAARLEDEAMKEVLAHAQDEDKTEFIRWSAILAERSAFKHDIADAPSEAQETQAETPGTERAMNASAVLQEIADLVKEGYDPISLDSDDREALEIAISTLRNENP